MIITRYGITKKLRIHNIRVCTYAGVRVRIGSVIMTLLSTVLMRNAIALTSSSPTALFFYNPFGSTWFLINRLLLVYLTRAARRGVEKKHNDHHASEPDLPVAIYYIGMCIMCVRIVRAVYHSRS